MVIEQKNNEVIFRLPITTKIGELQDIANFFKYKEYTKNSSASQKQVDILVKEIKLGRWKKNKAKFNL